MEANKIGCFIRDVRLERGMTQQQLADKLGVTDKAVSKWERGVSCPDITLLRELADALEVSVAELLAGERDASPPVPPEVEDVVVDAVAYAETARQRNGGWRFYTFVVLSILCGAGALVCFIFLCVCRGKWSWPAIAIQSIALGWGVCYPLLRVGQYPIRRSLTVLSLAIIPYLAYLPDHILTLQFRVLMTALLSVAYLWAVYFICVRCRRQKLLATGGILFLGGILSVGISLLVNGDFSNFISGIALSAAGAAFMIGFRARRGRTQYHQRV